MPLNTSGPISIGGSTVGQSINLEFGRSATQQTSMSQLYRGGGIVPNATQNANIPTSGAISLGNFYGAVNRAAISFTYTANTQQASLNVTSISGYIAGLSDITVTVNSGIYLWSDDLNTAGLTLTGGASGDTLTLVNNGFIMGRGGSGAYGAANGQTAGPALSLGFNTTVNNTNGSAYIGGGGGGGGGRRAQVKNAIRIGGGGGGAGGGAGGLNQSGDAAGVGGGGAGGAIGLAGLDGTNTPGSGGGSGGGGGGASASITSGFSAAGGGGGRIFPGVGGAGRSGTGGAGGSANNVGGNNVTTNGAGGGGGWGAAGGSGAQGAGGSGGQAVRLNGFSVTWVSGDTSRIYGAVS